MKDFLDKVLAAARTWFAAVKKKESLRPFEHPLFIAIAEWQQAEDEERVAEKDFPKAPKVPSFEPQDLTDLEGDTEEVIEVVETTPVLRSPPPTLRYSLPAPTKLKLPKRKASLRPKSSAQQRTTRPFRKPRQG